MNNSEWIQQIISANKRYTIPIMTHPGIEIIGCSVKDVVTNGEMHARAIKELNEQFPSKAATVIMDLTVEAEAFGCRIEFPENDMPHIIGRLVDSYEAVEKLEIPKLTAKRIPEYLKANRLAVQLIEDKPVFAGAIGPFSLAGRLFDMSEMMIACYLEPDTIRLLLDKCTQFIESYCNGLKQAGCYGVILAEPAAGLLSDDDCTQFSSVYIKRIVKSVQNEDFMVVLHNCGNTGHCTHAMTYTGAKAYHFGNAISMTDALEACPSDALVMGNIDPVGIFRMMTPEQIRSKVTSLLEQTKDFPNFVLSSGCDVPPHVPLENISAYYDALAAFNSKQ